MGGALGGDAATRLLELRGGDVRPCESELWTRPAATAVSCEDGWPRLRQPGEETGCADVSTCAAQRSCHARVKTCARAWHLMQALD